MEQDRNAGKFRSQRLPQRTYGATSAYFVTIYAYQREPFLKIPVLEQILRQQWQDLPQRFPEVSLDQFVILPDQVHFIVWISAHTPSSPTLPPVIGAYKSLCAVAWLRHLKETGSEESGRIWQKGYDNRVIRDKDDLERTRRSIQTMEDGGGLR